MPFSSFILHPSSLADAPPSPNPSYEWVWIAMIIFGASYLLLRSSAKKKRDPLSSSRAGLSLAQQRATERAMESLLVDLSNMARDISAQLDTRAAKLEALLTEADEKITQLRQLQSHPPSPHLPTSPSPSRDDDDAYEHPPLRLPLPEPKKPPTPIDPRHAEVYRLADQGQTPPQIAHHLNRPSGEIELILALRAR